MFLLKVRIDHTSNNTLNSASDGLDASNAKSARGKLEALGALAAALAAVPQAFRSHLKLLEQFSSSALCNELSSAALPAAASHCLSLLPSVTGKLAAPMIFLKRPAVFCLLILFSTILHAD